MIQFNCKRIHKIEKISIKKICVSTDSMTIMVKQLFIDSEKLWKNVKRERLIYK